MTRTIVPKPSGAVGQSRQGVGAVASSSLRRVGPGMGKTVIRSTALPQPLVRGKRMLAKKKDEDKGGEVELDRKRRHEVEIECGSPSQKKTKVT